ncbi:helix-turn-helix domain-containing protein [Streptomyces sp. B1-3]|uniref:helix-turn-helix domain-containing protein n=1 Tax=Streptomyces sp. B1-3 TaxID=3141453 RepID=UPI003D277317
MRSTQYVPAGPRRAELAVHLEDLRRTAGLTFAELAAATARLSEEDLGAEISAATLKRAARCEVVPREDTVRAFARACGVDFLDEHHTLRLWRAARAEERGKRAALQAPSVPNIRTFADLVAALAAAYEDAGAPPLAVLQQRAGTRAIHGDVVEGAVLLPTTTAWRIIHRKVKYVGWDQCAAFLRACGHSHRRLEKWRQAWTRATAAPGAPAPVHTSVPRDRVLDLYRMTGTTDTWFRRILQQMNPEDVETAFVLGAHQLLAQEARRNGAGPAMIRPSPDAGDAAADRVSGRDGTRVLVSADTDHCARSVALVFPGA